MDEGASEFESFLADLSTRFTGIHAHEVDAEIERLLRDLCEFLGTGRATLFEFSASGSTLSPSDIEGEHILRILERGGGRINGEGNAAALLGLEPSTLRSRMQKLGIRRPARPRVPGR